MRYETKEEILALGEPDPEFLELLKANPPPPVDYSSLESFAEMAERRNVLQKQLLGATPPSITRTEMTYKTSDGTENRAILFQPTTPPSTGSPLVVIYHGGGWCIGTPEGEEQTCRNLVLAFGATCISLAYRLGPKWKFPYAVNDAWDGLQWAATQARSFGADPAAGFIVGGTSAGGNLAAVMTYKARDSKMLSAPLTGSALVIPAVCSGTPVPEQYEKYMFSREQNREVPVLPQAAVDMFNKGYAADVNDHVNYSPLKHPNGHKGLPKTLLMVDGMDPLRDEALVYERILKDEAGVDTKLYMYPGLPHGHWGFFPSLKSSTKFRKEQIEGYGWLLGREPDLSAIVQSAKPAAV